MIDYQSKSIMINFGQFYTILFPYSVYIRLTQEHNQLTVMNYQLTIINNCENLAQKRNQRNNTKMRNFVILLFPIYRTTNPVQHWYESHNFTEN